MPVVAVAKWGNSFAVRILKAVAEVAGLRESDTLTIEASLGQIAPDRTHSSLAKSWWRGSRPRIVMTKCPSGRSG